MESISHQDIHFLIALSASEGALLQEIIWEFERWKCQKEDVLVILKNLVKDGTVSLCKPIANSDFSDLTLEETLQAIATWDRLKRIDLMLFLTESGQNRWEIDDWGISTKRAHHLMFR